MAFKHSQTVKMDLSNVGRLLCVQLNIDDAEVAKRVNIVSSALNGKLQHLQASVCDKDEIEFLNFATVWVPSIDADEEDDDDCYFSKEESKFHQDIRSFFTPKGRSPKKARLIKDLNKSNHKLKENDRNAADANEPPVCHHQRDPENFPAGEKSLKCHSGHNDSLIFNDAPLKTINASDSITSSRKRRSSFSGGEISDFEATLVVGSSESPCPIKKESISKRRCITNVSVDRISGDLSQVYKHKYEDSILTSESPDKPETSDVTPDELSWSCSKCTYHNHNILPYCEMCNTAKPILKTVPKKRAQKSQSRKQRSSVSSTKRFSLSKIDFIDEDLDDFDISRSSKTSFPTPKRSPKIKHFKKISSKKIRTRIVVDDFVSVPHQSDFATVEESDTKTSSEKQNEKICVDCDNTCLTAKCASCKAISLQQKKPVENESDLKESEQDTSILEDIAVAESWISSQSAPESSQEFWTCSECGFVSQAEECDSCWNPKPEKSQIIPSKTIKNYKDDFHISKTKKHETQPLGVLTFGINSPHFGNALKSRNSIQKVEDVDASPSSTSAQPRQETSCDTTLDELLEVKAELDDTDIVHHAFKYRPSLHTSRIYLYDEDGDFLGASFFPVDVHLKNMGSLPKLLQHPFSFKLVQQFVRRWNRLRLPQQKQLCKSGELFVNPQQIIDDMKWRKKQNPSTKRFLTRDDLANSAVSKASNIGGSLRIITKPPNSRRTTFSVSSTKSLSSLGTELKQLQKCDKNEAQGNNITEESSTCATSKPTSSTSSDTVRESISHRTKSPLRDSIKSSPRNSPKSPPSDWKSPARGSKLPVTSVRSPGKGAYLQAVDAEGCPLCIFCNKPCRAANPDSRHQSADWDHRYCSENCKNDHKMQWKSSHYIRQQLFQLEHGICQLCGLDAQQLFVQTRNLPKNQRKEFLQASKYASLSVAELNKIIKAPAEGQFWHADHIVAVADGGGLCSLENFRTLCVMCHMTVTANQIRERSKARKTSGMKDIKSFFKPQ